MLRMYVGAMPDMSTSQVTARLGPHPGDLTRLLPQLAASLPGAAAEPLSSAADTERYRLFDAVAGWLGAASSHQPRFLVIDDLQWATTTPLLLLRPLVGTSSTDTWLHVAPPER